MKITVVGLVFVMVLLVGCTTMPKPTSFDTSIQYESESKIIILTVEPRWTNFSLYGSGFNGFYCTFQNTSDEVARIVWQKSSVNYAGNSYVPFIDGQKYVDAQSPMSPMIISSGGVLSKSIFSSNQPTYDEGWQMRPIATTEVELIICIESNQKEEYVIAKINAVYEE